MSTALARAERELAAFGESLSQLGRAAPSLADFFRSSREVVLARAPGRLDVMGGIADYSGSLVIEQPLQEAALVAVARSNDSVIRVASLGEDGLRSVSFDAAELARNSETYPALAQYFRHLSADPWVAYVAGTLGALRLEFGVKDLAGARLLLRSSVPQGKGLSSSAAIEVATLRALCALCDVSVTGPVLALSCQRVENLVVGAACGVMDQMTSACGEASRLLALLCQPARIEAQLPLPDSLAVFGIDSGLRHAVASDEYGQVRTAAFMGLRIVAELLGAHVRPERPGRVRLEQDRLVGYLANVQPHELSAALLAALPERMLGDDFLRQYQGITDPVSRVDPQLSYPLRAATLHPVYEHARARTFVDGLAGARTDAEFEQLGSLMYASHEGYGACGLGSNGTDQLVRMLRAAGSSAGVFGARITGGGSGGSVAVLARASALPELHRLAADYSQHTGRPARVFAGSSPGALTCPPLWLPL